MPVLVPQKVKVRRDYFFQECFLSNAVVAAPLAKTGGKSQQRVCHHAAVMGRADAVQ